MLDPHWGLLVYKLVPSVLGQVGSPAFPGRGAASQPWWLLPHGSVGAVLPAVQIFQVKLGIWTFMWNPPISEG